MHHYPHHIGDFNAATRHLTRVERSLYRDAIELYYDKEKSLTGDFEVLCRRLMARSDEEKEGLRFVLSEFFEFIDGRYVHHRCEEEILAYHNNQTNKSKAGKASAEARRKRAEARRNKEKQQELTGAEQSLNSVESEGQQNPTNQEPITNNQEPIKKNIHADLAEKLNVDVGLVERVVRHRREIKHPANTDKKITLVVKDLASCVDQGFFKSLDQAMDRLDETEWRTLKPEYLEEKGNAKNKRTYPQCGTRSFEQIDYGAGVNTDGTF